MTGLQIAFSIILILLSVTLIVLVLVQKDRNGDASAVMGGGSSEFFDKTKGHRKDSMLSKATIVCGVLLAVCTVASLAISLFA